MNWKLLSVLGLAAALAVACRTEAPHVASPVANGPPGPTPELPNGPAQTAPPPAPANEDRVVASAVRTSLRNDPALGQAGQQIQVKVRKGVVTLRGELPPTVDHNAFLARLAKLPGVDRIEDEIQTGP